MDEHELDNLPAYIPLWARPRTYYDPPVDADADDIPDDGSGRAYHGLSHGWRLRTMGSRSGRG